MADDPRTHITPDAFGVAPELLGFALAAPTRRLAAILIDLALAAFIARLGIEYLLAAAAALFAWRAIGGPAERLLAGRGRVVFRAASAVLALVIVVNVWNGAVQQIRRLEHSDRGGSPGTPGVRQKPGDGEERDVEVALRDLGLSTGEQANFMLRFARLQLADPQAADERGAELGRWVREKTSPGEQREQFGTALATAIPPTARAAFMRELGSGPNANDSARGVSAAGGAAPTADSPRPAGAGADSARPDSARSGGAAADTTLTDSARPAAATADSARAAADSVRLLAAANQQLRDRNQRLRTELEAARGKEEGGVRGWLSGISNDLGLGFGWFALYFTAFTVLGRGQTPGKRLLGIKVLRCDNRPIGWWLAFERFGAYAASFSTGLLGFAQILWDRNRQALHDKAADTVVVRLRDGQPFRIA